MEQATRTEAPEQTAEGDELNIQARALLETGQCSEAIRLLERATALGSGAAMCTMGTVYDYGRGVSEDAVKAFEWYKKGAELGDPTSCYNLGIFWRTGRGCAVNKQLAMEWLAKAVELGYTIALVNIGAMLMKGEAEGGIDPPGAVGYFERAAALGHSQAMYTLGTMYTAGVPGVPRDLAKAHRYLVDAKRAGHVGAAEYLKQDCFNDMEDVPLKFSARELVSQLQSLSTAVFSPCVRVLAGMAHVPEVAAALVGESSLSSALAEAMEESQDERLSADSESAGRILHIVTCLARLSEEASRNSLCTTGVLHGLLRLGAGNLRNEALSALLTLVGDDPTRAQMLKDLGMKLAVTGSAQEGLHVDIQLNKGSIAQNLWGPGPDSHVG